MKSLCTGALALLACLGGAGQAAAQGGASGTSSLASLPAPDPATVSYQTPAEPYDSMFASRQNSAANSQSGELIDGSNGPSQFEQAVHAGWEECAACEASGGTWFGAVGGLAMGRNRPNAYWTSFDTNTDELVLNTQTAGADWTGGWQVTIGYVFGGCGCGGGGCGPYGPIGGCAAQGPGIGFTYWGLGNMGGFAQVDSPTDQLDATFVLLDPATVSGEIEIGGQPFSDFFNNSAGHRVTRDDSASNYEVNVFFGTFDHYRWTLVPFAGFRYFRFDERLAFAGLSGGSIWGGNGGIDQAELSFRTINDLYGLQLGTYATYSVCGRFSWFVGPKLGLFGNQMTSHSRLARGDGLLAFDVNAQKSDFSLLGEIDTGFNWFFNPQLMAYLGYRVMGVTNVALGDNQFVQGIGDVKQSGSLILHGLMIGGGYTF